MDDELCEKMKVSRLHHWMFSFARNVLMSILKYKLAYARQNYYCTIHTHW